METQIEVDRGQLSLSDVLCIVLVLAKRRSGDDRFALRVSEQVLQKLFSQLRTKHELMAVLNGAAVDLQFSGLIDRPSASDPYLLVVEEAAERYFDYVLEPKLLILALVQWNYVADMFLELTESFRDKWPR